MTALAPNEMLVVGGGRCGEGWQALVVETTITAAAGFIGFGISGGNLAGAYWGARGGYLLASAICRTG